jgi:iron(III) transport system substrate-binding protein
MPRPAQETGATGEDEMNGRLAAWSAILAVAAALALASAARAEAPVGKITPELVEKAKEEGKVVWYTSSDLEVSERIARDFEAKYPGVAVQVERTGAERVFQRLAQEYDSNIHTADIVNSSDASHFIVWKRNGWLAPYVPEDVALYFPPEHKDKDGMYATWRATLAVMGYNTKQVKPEEAPKSFADLLAPKWKGRIVKAHPSYSGTILTSTFETARDVGWDFFEKLAKQRVMQVQSAADPPKKLALGERAVMVDGTEYVTLRLIAQGAPIAIVYPAEGAPLVVGPTGIFKDAPHPNAARLFDCYLFSAEAQQLMVDVGELRSVHPKVKEKEGRVPLSQIKTLRDDAAAMEPKIEEIKEKYASYFGT